ncbi:MAG: rRNA maturation RNase YbeY [Anaerolineales bacterium]
MIIIDPADAFKDKIEDELLRKAASRTLEECLDEEVSLTIVVTGDEGIKSLNKRHRGVEEATDVLAFTADYMDPDLGHRYLGDVLISFPTAASQALERGHSVGEELQLLAVHGVLHLLGYDHLKKGEQEEMWSLQKQILKDLGLDLDVREW